MAGTTTRDRALEAALELFSQKGYQAVSMGDIAGALGIKAPSLYKHFKGKEELYAALFPPLEDHYAGLWEQVAKNQTQLERQALSEGAVSVQQLEWEAMDWLQRELESAQGAALRRLMVQEQFTHPDRLRRWLWETPMALYQDLFARLIQREVLRRGDPHVMAMEYLAPLVLLLGQMDQDPARRAEGLEEARQHIRQFHRIFARRENRGAAPSGVGRLFRR